MTQPPPRPTGPTPAHTITIAAGADAVWAILADFARWQDWNPLYVQSQGRLVPGEEIAFTVALEGMKPAKGKAKVVRVERPRLIEYAIGGARSPVRAYRFIELSETTPGHCTVRNGEVMGGVLGRILARFLAPKVAQGLQAMNEALKAKAEAAAA